MEKGSDAKYRIKQKYLPFIDKILLKVLHLNSSRFSELFHTEKRGNSTKTVIEIFISSKMPLEDFIMIVFQKS